MEATAAVAAVKSEGRTSAPERTRALQAVICALVGVLCLRRKVFILDKLMVFKYSCWMQKGDGYIGGLALKY